MSNEKASVNYGQRNPYADIEREALTQRRDLQISEQEAFRGITTSFMVEKALREVATQQRISLEQKMNNLRREAEESRMLDEKLKLAGRNARKIKMARESLETGSPHLFKGSEKTYAEKAKTNYTHRDALAKTREEKIQTGIPLKSTQISK